MCPGLGLGLAGVADIGAEAAGAGALDLAGASAADIAASGGIDLAALGAETGADVAGLGAAGAGAGELAAGAGAEFVPESLAAASDLFGGASLPASAASDVGAFGTAGSSLADTAATTTAGAGAGVPSFSPIGAAGAAGPTGTDVAGSAADQLFGPPNIASSMGADPGALPTGSAPTAGTVPPAANPAITPGTSIGGASPITSAGDLTGSGAAATGASATPAAAADTGGFMSLLQKNPLMLASLGLGAGSLGYRALTSGNQLPQQGNLTNIANQAGALSSQDQALEGQLINPLLTGTLPSDAEAKLDQAMNDAVTATKSKYAQLGLTGSTAEADQLNYLQQQMQGIRFQIAQQMATSALTAGSQANSALGTESGIFQALMQNQIQQDTALQNAIAAFAGQAGLAAAISKT